ncbi:hypothetical protein O181_058556 [Austropuccinia psidii MF-1]|uniref:Integrase catalytic domain-containing protein n=1 Tax=Austropuccinia psidii MF-1 TaxID=1389203 RepID=A0A9Q3EHA9_9BASI|nr:hypothetical protein [Austropuccinia psidii MF-1]
MSYIHAIQNKSQRCPGFLYTNQGGEFYSTSFRSKTKALGIVFERGPANSPQTNSIAERFNQTLLTKCWCLLAQSNVPIWFCDEAIKLSSTLINLLPSCSLNWKFPFSVLVNLKSNIEPVCNLNSLIPFGLKVFVRRQPESKVLPPSKPLRYLGPEDYSDASRFLDPQTGKIIVSRDYTTVPFKLDYPRSGSLKKPVEGLPCTTSNNSFSTQPSQIAIIPSWPCKNNIPSTNPTITDDRSPLTPIPSSEPTITINSEPNQTPIERCTTISSPSCIPLPHKKGYAYVPHYCNASKDINRDNITTKPRIQRNIPKAVTPPPAEDGDL